MKKITLSELANYLDAELHGDGSIEITGIAALNTAQAGQISFLDNSSYQKHLADTKATAVILQEDLVEKCPVSAIAVKNPYHAYALAAKLFDRTPQAKTGIAATAIIDPTAEIDPSATIAEYSVIGPNVKIAKHVVIGPSCVINAECEIAADTCINARVTLYHNVRIGQRCILHSGVVLGSDGFGIAKEKGQWLKVPQLGGVLIGNDVEIGANTTIDRAALGDTIIEDGVKLDNQIQIGHNTKIGAYTAVAGCVGISGSATIGEHCIIGGGTCIAGHIEIADNVMISGMSMVTHSIHKQDIYSSGTGLQTNREWRKSAARFHKLDQLARRVKELEKTIKTLAEENS